MNEPVYSLTCWKITVPPQETVNESFMGVRAQGKHDF